MSPEQMQALVKAHINEIKEFRKQDLPVIIGVEAVKHYNKSFVNEGFTDKTVKKWDDVERRKPESEWYGFSYRSNSAKPVTKTAPSSGKGGGKIKKGLTNFSPEATKNRVLIGSSTELKNSIDYVVKTDRVSIGSDKPYAAVHQFGLPAKIFGKKEHIMKARPFIGKSEVLNAAITAKIERELKRVLNL